MQGPPYTPATHLSPGNPQYRLFPQEVALLEDHCALKTRQTQLHYIQGLLPNHTLWHNGKGNIGGNDWHHSVPHSQTQPASTMPLGGPPNRTIVDSLLYLTHWVKEAWHKRKVETIIFLDIANAFPNTVTDWLLKNMARLGYPSEIISFFEAMLKDRKTMLSFDDFTSLPIDIDNGIVRGRPLGSPFSLYSFYFPLSLPPIFLFHACFTSISHSLLLLWSLSH